MTTKLPDFDQIATEAWNRQKTFLERLYDTLVGEGNWEPYPPKTTYRIYSKDIRPVYCHICQSCDGWTLEGDDVKVFVCDHGLESGVIRRVSSVPFTDIFGFVETSRPPE